MSVNSLGFDDPKYFKMIVKKPVKQHLKFAYSNCSFVSRNDSSIDDKNIRQKFFRVRNRVEGF